MRTFNFVSSCGAGLESLVAQEVATCGGKIWKSGNGSVSWQGSLEAGYRSVLWSRFSSRVFLQLQTFGITNEDSLYTQSLGIDWLAVLTDGATFAINCTLAGDSPVTHSRFAALRIKDGLVDRYREVTGERPSVQPVRPDLQLHLHLEGNQASIALDLSGESLHRRGYRQTGGLAPLKETLAAGIIALSGWEAGETLVDPMCGTGTLLIEAALMFSDSAPGLSRNYFGFWGWTGHDQQLWDRLIEEAIAREEVGMARQWPQLIGYDSDPTVVRAARANITKAGLQNHIQVHEAELAHLTVPQTKGLILANLPYGERLSEKEVVPRLYRAYGRIVGQRCEGWRVAAFISVPELTDSFGLAWQKKWRLFNGPINCRLLLGSVSAPTEERFVWTVRPAEGNRENDFANRLRKNLKQLLKWAEREGVFCFRIYDADLPEFNCCIDLYTKWVHMQEYAPPKSVPVELAAERFRLAVQTVKEVLGIRSDRLFLKTRSRQRGRQQYQQQASQKKFYEVREDDCYLLVNFTDYLDTGLFLDHRPIRRRIFQEARGKRFLNLFGYTGAATIQAAAGGAVRTTTVDLSANYLRWARENLALNGFGEHHHETVAADCLAWLSEERGSYDLIFVDPPTFSNTKKKERIFDIGRDHERLLHLAMQRLTRDGLLIFSTNFSRFQLAPELAADYLLKDITGQTIPVDFQRNKKIHQCWEFRHRQRA